MVKFFFRISRFIAFPVAFVILWITFLELYPRCESCSNQITFDSNLDYKLWQFGANEVLNSIIICGDSRAERQIIPSIITKKTGRNCLNLGVSSGDLAMTASLIELIDSSNTFVISASSWQINDGAIDKGYLSVKSFSELSFIDKIGIYKGLNNYDRVLSLYQEMSWYLVDKYVSSYLLFDSDYMANLDSNGYLRIDGTFYSDTVRLDSITSNHPWYKDTSGENYRLKIFSDNLKRIANKKSKIYIYQPPICPYWREKTNELYIDEFEMFYSSKLKELAMEFPNVKFLDYYSFHPDTLVDSLFYDFQHLNFSGAELFSSIIADSLKLDLDVDAVFGSPNISEALPKN